MKPVFLGIVAGGSEGSENQQEMGGRPAAALGACKAVATLQGS